MFTFTLNELRIVVKANTKAGQSGASNKKTFKSTAKADDFRVVRRRERRYSDDTSQTVKKSTISIHKICHLQAAYKISDN
jgi:hypothetical protein